MLKDISIDELIPGMYVSQVVEQTGTMRVRSGGLVKTQNVIEQLRKKGIVRVEVDYARSRLGGSNSKSAKPVTSAGLAKANTLYTEAISIQRGVLEQLKSRSADDIAGTEQLAQHIIDGVFENQDALACLTMIKNTDEYMLEHSINCSILMAIFARHQGYDRATIDTLCTGALLMDVGMSMIPEHFRHKDAVLSEKDWQTIQSHVPKGLALVSHFSDLDASVTDIIAQHHERVDGSGYPNKLQNDAISIFARMAAIVDSYDAMISNRTHQRGVTAAVAMKRLTANEGLDQNLVRQFIRSLGVHPVGSLVKLNSGRLAMVVQSNSDEMHKPVVMTFYSMHSNNYSEVKRVDLAKANDRIEAAVRPDDFGINLPKFFRDVFIHQLPG
ncbi:HD-GYP domain-containing protein [Alteromonas lipotrueiana]|uniref:HD-GYP domain-containing protein n=1 Tax=Alteromonas lipotrueiana TaxID=2803815 RepID=UPI001C4562CC|nr:HD-GYP domain-containing protein [Alteromonas lipotrueiana]